MPPDRKALDPNSESNTRRNLRAIVLESITPRDNRLPFGKDQLGIQGYVNELVQEGADNEFYYIYRNYVNSTEFLRDIKYDVSYGIDENGKKTALFAHMPEIPQPDIQTLRAWGKLLYNVPKTKNEIQLEIVNAFDNLRKFVNDKKSGLDPALKDSLQKAIPKRPTHYAADDMAYWRWVKEQASAERQIRSLADREQNVGVRNKLLELVKGCKTACESSWIGRNGLMRTTAPDAQETFDDRKAQMSSYAKRMTDNRPGIHSEEWDAMEAAFNRVQSVLQDTAPADMARGGSIEKKRRLAAAMSVLQDTAHNYALHKVNQNKLNKNENARRLRLARNIENYARFDLRQLRAVTAFVDAADAGNKENQIAFMDHILQSFNDVERGHISKEYWELKQAVADFMEAANQDDKEVHKDSLHSLLNYTEAYMEHKQRHNDGKERGMRRMEIAAELRSYLINVQNAVLSPNNRIEDPYERYDEISVIEDSLPKVTPVNDTILNAQNRAKERLAAKLSVNGKTISEEGFEKIKDTLIEDMRIVAAGERYLKAKDHVKTVQGDPSTLKDSQELADRAEKDPEAYLHEKVDINVTLKSALTAAGFTIAAVEEEKKQNLKEAENEKVNEKKEPPKASEEDKIVPPQLGLSTEKTEEKKEVNKTSFESSEEKKPEPEVVKKTLQNENHGFQVQAPVQPNIDSETRDLFDEQTALKEYFKGQYLSHMSDEMVGSQKSEKAYHGYDIKKKDHRFVTTYYKNTSMPKEILATGDQDVIKEYLSTNPKLFQREISHLRSRVSVMDHLDKLEQYYNSPQHQPKKIGRAMKREDDYSVLPLRMERLQDTRNGCWSCAFSLLLQGRGVNVDQTLIRRYRPKLTLGEAGTLSDELVNTTNTDSINTMFDYATLVDKLCPNTVMKKRTYMNGIDDPDEINVFVLDSIFGQDAPVAFTDGTHWMTIFGYNDETGKYLAYDSNSPQDHRMLTREVDLMDLLAKKQELQFVALHDLQPNEDIEYGKNGEIIAKYPKDGKGKKQVSDLAYSTAGTGFEILDGPLGHSEIYYPSMKRDFSVDYNTQKNAVQQTLRKDYKAPESKGLHMLANEAQADENCQKIVQGLVDNANIDIMANYISQELLTCFMQNVYKIDDPNCKKYYADMKKKKNFKAQSETVAGTEDIKEFTKEIIKDSNSHKNRMKGQKLLADYCNYLKKKSGSDDACYEKLQTQFNIPEDVRKAAVNQARAKNKNKMKI